MLPHPHLPLYTSGTFKCSIVIVQSLQNHKIIRGTLTLTVWPEVALAALGELYHQSAKLSAAFQVPLEGQVIQTLLLLALKEEIQPSLHLPSLYLGSWALVFPQWRILGIAQVENRPQMAMSPVQGILFSGA